MKQNEITLGDHSRGQRFMKQITIALGHSGSRGLKDKQISKFIIPSAGPVAYNGFFHRRVLLPLEKHCDWVNFTTAPSVRDRVVFRSIPPRPSWALRIDWVGL
jgi:hypothetical protein